MKKNKFDYIICGGGASGLLLANELISDPFFINKRILLIEMDKKNINDRTWCFWEKGKGKLDKIVSKSWNYACFKDKNFQKNYETKPYTYKLIRGIDFYNNFRNLNRKQNNFTYLNAKISNINKLENIVITNKGTFSADYIFTSILDIKLLENQKKYPFLKQHFIGQLVEVKNDIFNPDLVTFMDFDIPQKKSTRFMYILPFSKTKALVEYTLFSKNELEEIFTHRVLIDSVAFNNGGHLFDDFAPLYPYWSSTESPSTTDFRYSYAVYPSNFTVLRGKILEYKVRAVRSFTINTGIKQVNNREKQIIKIVNIMGQECQKQLNKILLYIYDDGSIEKNELNNGASRFGMEWIIGRTDFCSLKSNPFCIMC